MWGITKFSLFTIVLGGILFAPLILHAAAVAPSAADIQITQGGEARSSVIIINDSAETKNYRLNIIGVELGTALDEMSFYSLDESVLNWFELSQSQISIEADQEAEFNITVRPALEAKSQVLTVGVQIIEEPDSTFGIGVISGFVSLLFVTIGSDLEEGVEITDFFFDQQFVSTLPITCSLTLQNQGERVVQPIGLVEIKNVFGKTVKRLDLNPDWHRVAQGQTRTFQLVWGEGESPSNFLQALQQEIRDRKFGLFYVTAEFEPWVGGEKISTTRSLVIIPWRSLLILSLIVLIGIKLFCWLRSSRA